MPENVFQIIGLQRCGNHAIIDWVMSLFREPRFINNRPHDFFSQPDLVEVVRETEGDCAIVSFEDTAIRFVSERQRMEDVVPVAQEDFADARCLRLFILRDPYNNWASRVKAQEGRGLTGVPDLPVFIENWVYMAARWRADPDSVILYNRWRSDEGYRREVCARLGGTYSEKTLDEVPRFGGGSSFEARMQRPTYAQILARLPRYANRRFLARLATSPMNYIRRLVAPRPKGRSLGTEERWQFIVEREDCRPLLEDRRVQEASLEIFGFCIDADGQRRTAGQE